MDYYGLLEDFLNKDRTEKYFTVEGWEDRGSYIEAYVNQLNDNESISLFDLMVFVYSKK